MQLIKMMLEKFQHPFVFDLNLMLNLKYNVLLKSLFTTETNLMYFSKNSKNITLSNKLVPLHETNPFMAQYI